MLRPTTMAAAMQPAGPPGPVPLPYPNVASGPVAPPENTQLLHVNMLPSQMGSAIPSTAGDEAGSDIMRRLMLATDPSPSR